MSLSVAGGHLACPALASVGDATGERQLPLIYEGAYRASLRRLHEQVSAGAHDPADLLRLAAALPGTERICAALTAAPAQPR